ncbi:hypothetical protein MMC30_000838 [Trapelia coarctata]|nr:hypothetical protein [Trapelia coarctata]
MVIPVGLSDCIAAIKVLTDLYHRCKDYEPRRQELIAAVESLNTIERCVEDLGANWSQQWIAANQDLTRRIEQKIDSDPMNIRRAFSSNALASVFWSKSSRIEILNQVNRHAQLAASEIQSEVVRRNERFQAFVVQPRSSIRLEDLPKDMTQRFADWNV